MRQDRYLSCSSCHTQFLWTPHEQAEDEQPPSLCRACRFLQPAEGRRRGVVKFYSLRKHWGFITQADGVEVFFHRSALVADHGPSPVEGELVEFAVEQSARGPQAIALRRLSLDAG